MQISIAIGERHILPEEFIANHPECRPENFGGKAFNAGYSAGL
jgi:hypothetical protein